MNANPRLRPLLDELLNSQTTPEAVCVNCPELLPEVREHWRRMQRVRAKIEAMFPSPDDPVKREPEPLSGDVTLPRIAGYTVEALLGRGGMGVVFRARHLGLNRVVALKMVIAGVYAGPSERERFQREAETVALLRHANIVQIHDFGNSEGQPYFTMEFVEGGSLSKKLGGIPQPPRETASLLSTLAGAVQIAHLGGVVHRDLKPSNVLLTAEGIPKISDFGLARRLDDDAGLTRTGATIGTPSYMAPEQAAGKRLGADPAVDIYALGAILYELLTGSPPFHSRSSAETVQMVLSRDPIAPSSLQPKVPCDLETICLKCLFKEPQFRYATASALKDDLDRFLRGEAIAARPERRLERLARRIRRRPVESASIFAGTLLAAAVIGVGLWSLYERGVALRRMEVERSVAERSADESLRQMATLMKTSSWAEAKSALERAKGWLGNRDSADLQNRVSQGARDLELVARLDAIRLTGFDRIEGSLDFARSDLQYEEAFREAGLGYIEERPEKIAARIQASNIQIALLAALDNWSMYTEDPQRLQWVLEVSRGADKDKTGWRGRARDLTIWKDEKALFDLVKTAPFPDQSVPLLMAIERRANAVPNTRFLFLKRIQQAHPDDFWINLRIADVLMKNENPSQAVGYYQAAIAIRPGVAIVHHNLGVALERNQRVDEAIEHFRQGVVLDPTNGFGELGVARCLWNTGHREAALEAFPVAICLNPKSSLALRLYGICLEQENRPAEALVQYRRAVAVDPTDMRSHKELRRTLMQRRQLEDAWIAWREALDHDPPNHDDWYGFAELCLYLGKEEEYLRARRDLLAKFERATKPHIAERVGRACLLRAASGEELRRIVDLASRASSVERFQAGATYPFFQFVQGLADYREGKFTQTISTMRGDAASVLGPAPRLVLAMALYHLGEVDQAQKSLQMTVSSYNWNSEVMDDQDGWIIHTLRREAERLMLPDQATKLKR